MSLLSFNYASVRLLLDGMLLMMACYALFSFLQHRQPIYLLYGAYGLLMMARLTLRDYDSLHLGQFPASQPLENTFESLAIVAYNLFAALLMEIRQRDSASYRVLRLMTLNLFVASATEWAMFGLGVPTGIRVGVFVLSRVLMVAGTIYIVPRLFRQPFPALRYFISGTAFFVAGAFAALLFLIFPGWFDRDPAHAFTFPLVYMQIGVVVEMLFFTMSISVKNRQTEQDKLRAQAELIEQLRENERKQQTLNRIRDDIARDLHDSVGSDLGTISLLTTVAARQHEQAAPLLDTIGQTARRVVEAMREIVWSLNSAHHTPENLNFRFREISYELFHNEPVTVSLDIDAGLAGQLSEAPRKEVFLIFKETLQNIRKHARASRVSVQLRKTPDNQLSLSIEDNGVGFDPATLPRINGLHNLRQRAQTLGGTLTIQSKPGAGTQITLICDYQALSEDDHKNEPLPPLPTEHATSHTPV